MEKIKFEIKSGTYYFAEIIKSSKEIFSVSRYEISDNMVKSVIKASKLNLEARNIHEQNHGLFLSTFLQLKGLVKSSFETKVFEYQEIDNVTFIKHYSKFSACLVPFNL